VGACSPFYMWHDTHRDRSISEYSAGTGINKFKKVLVLRYKFLNQLSIVHANCQVCHCIGSCAAVQVVCFVSVFEITVVVVMVMVFFDTLATFSTSWAFLNL
jgi:hypothetical protein